MFEQQLHNFEMVIQTRFVQTCVSKLQASGRNDVHNLARNSFRHTETRMKQLAHLNQHHHSISILVTQISNLPVGANWFIALFNRVTMLYMFMYIYIYVKAMSRVLSAFPFVIRPCTKISTTDLICYLVWVSAVAQIFLYFLRI